MDKKGKSVIVFVALMVITIFIVAVSAQVWDNPNGKVNFGHTHEWSTLLDFPAACSVGQFVSGVNSVLTCATPLIGTDNDWTILGINIFSAVLGNVGIGTNNPLAKLHINEDVSTTNKEVALITFSNDAPSIGVRGIRVVSTPLNVKGTQIGVEAQTSKTGGPDAQRGSAQALLSHVSGFFLRGTFLGVQGISKPNVLDNFDNTATSHGLGGLFIAKPDNTLTLDNTGTYWVGGAYGEVAGTIDNTPASGAVAGIIGIDNSVGSAKSYAGYFQGDIRTTGYTQLALTSGTPPAVDCDEVLEMGRMKVDDSGGGFLYVCTQTASGIGWVAK